MANRPTGDRTIWTGKVQALPSIPRQDPCIEGLELRAVIEVLQVRELVAQRVHEARVLERLARGHVPQPDLDAPIVVADAVAPLHVGAFGIERPIPQAEACTDAIRISPQSPHEIFLGAAIHRAPSVRVPGGPVNPWARSPGPSRGSLVPATVFDKFHAAATATLGTWNDPQRI